MGDYIGEGVRGRRARRDGNVVMVAALGGGCKARAKEGTGVGPPHKREGVNPRVLLPMRAQNARRACARARQSPFPCILRHEVNKQS